MKEFAFKINGAEYKCAVEEIEAGKTKVTVNGKVYEVETEAPIASPHRRNHAIGTVFVAALRNLQIGKMPARGDCALRLKFRKPCKCIEIRIKFVFKGRTDCFPYGIVRICSENGIHLRNLFLHFILIALRQTSCNNQ